MGKTSWLDETRLPANLVADEEQFRVLWALAPAEPHIIRIMGKATPVPRLQQAYLRSYKFSGTESKALPLPAEFQPYLDWANALGYGDFNAVLINWYADGENYIGAHADDERQLVKNSPVVTITLCQPSEADKKGFTAKPMLRKFRIRKQKTKEIVKDVMTPNGSVLIMGGRFQKKFTHEIVKITGAAAKQVGPRISITLRQFEPEPEKKKLDTCIVCEKEALFHEQYAVDRYFCGSTCQEVFHETRVPTYEEI